MSKKATAPIAAVTVVLALVGVFVAVQATTQAGDDTQPTRQVQFVDPAAQTITPTSSTTTATPVVSPTTTVAPSPARTTTVLKSTPKTTTVQKKVTVSEPSTEPTAASTSPEPSAPAAPTPGQPINIGTGNAPTGQFGPGAPTTSGN